ncbi:hypothetical protein Peur_069458 [Populus x canadensis]
MALWQIDPQKRETANRVAFSPTGQSRARKTDQQYTEACDHLSSQHISFSSLKLPISSVGDIAHHIPMCLAFWRFSMEPLSSRENSSWRPSSIVGLASYMSKVLANYQPNQIQRPLPLY